MEGTNASTNVQSPAAPEGSAVINPPAQPTGANETVHDIVPDNAGDVQQESTPGQRHAAAEAGLSTESDNARREAQELNEMREFLANPDYADSGIKTSADFVKMPKYGQFCEYVSKGLTFTEAYELTHRQELAEKRAKAARQAALNSINGKEHLQPAAGSAEDLSSIVVPDDVMTYYRAFHPRMTGKQIQEHYAKSQKEKGWN